MKKFMDDADFLLSTETGKRLYHDYSAKMPIIDYHCHINPKEIYDDKQFSSITEAWLGGDHYKWRAIRAMGVDEELITGAGDPREKFRAWAMSLTKAIGNPLFCWTHLELKRFFGYDGVLNEKTADEVYDFCNKKLAEGLTVRKMIKMSNVEVICTTDDPIDSLEWHKKLAEIPDLGFRVLPAWRPDKCVLIDAKEVFAPYIATLAEVSGVKIATLGDLYAALRGRLDFFAAMGCANSDHALVSLMYAPATAAEVDAIFQKALSGGDITADEAQKYKYALLTFLAGEYARRGWVMQIHYNTLRNNHPLYFKKLGPDTGFDAIGNSYSATETAAFMSALVEKDALPKMIFYSVNHYDNDSLVSLMQCFPKAGVKNNVTLGSAWWFNDTKEGMTKQMKDFASGGVFSNFLGMLTDSRSFLSYTRHEYFRRLMCSIVGEWVEAGEYPCDFDILGKLVQDISYNNTKEYFGF